MENLSVSPSRFDDVGIILNGNNCFVGLETPDGVEACTLDKPFVFAITGIDGLPLFVGLVNQPG